MAEMDECITLHSGRRSKLTEQRKPQKANLNADHSMRLSGGRTSGAFANSVMIW